MNRFLAMYEFVLLILLCSQLSCCYNSPFDILRHTHNYSQNVNIYMFVQFVSQWSVSHKCSEHENGYINAKNKTPTKQELKKKKKREKIPTMKRI